eukprot:TRINITY_DN104_c0_g1_i5.p1 TRINITY_DN104_c0_g1~~TRINITY_DN104_c0_g1_i5.p1  ORF type:complete len:450 (-),score=141.91 TRINITY_DN104_c0_g1_i5:87-1436(-)
MEDSLLGDHACYSLVRVPDDGAHTLGSLAESKGITCSRGQGFYQLGKKKESVSEKKEMVLVERQDEDDEDAAAVVDAIDDAAKVRKELGIGAAKANINESVSEDFMVFVQSTSANRKLVPGAYALYRRDDIDVGKKRKLVLSGAESSAPKRAKKSAEPEVAHLPAEVWGAVAGKLDASSTRSLAATSKALKDVGDGSSIQFVRTWIDKQKQSLPAHETTDEDYFERVVQAGLDPAACAAALHPLLEAYQGMSWEHVPRGGEDGHHPYWTVISVHVDKDSVLKWPDNFRWDGAFKYPAYPLRGIDKALKPGASKVGGLPHLPADGSIHYSAEFIGQYNCADLVMYDLRCIFPATGMLYFFMDGVQYYNGDLSALSPAAPPADVFVNPVQPLEFRLGKGGPWTYGEEGEPSNTLMMNPPATDTELMIDVRSSFNSVPCFQLGTQLTSTVHM